MTAARLTISKARELARSLAVEYEGYHDALRRNDDNSICVWGEMLLATQNAIGVNLHKPEGVRRMIDAARARKALIAA